MCILENCLTPYGLAAVIVAITLLVLGKKVFNGGVNHFRPNLSGKVAIITGGNTGIGKETAVELASLGASVVIASRNLSKSKAAVEEIKQRSKNEKVDAFELDLSDLESVKNFAENFQKKYKNIELLINNSGLMALPNRMVSKQGIEMQMATNHYGHVYLTYLLLPLLKKSQPSRIINLSSTAHYQTLSWNWEDLNQEKSYTPWGAYGNSKLANIYFTVELHKKLEGTGVKTVCLHPGAVRTELLSNYFVKYRILNYLQLLFWPFWWYLTKDCVQGAQTTLHVALCDYDKLQSGRYYKDCRVNHLGKMASSQENAKRFWDITMSRLKIQI